MNEGKYLYINGAWEMGEGTKRDLLTLTMNK